MNPNFKPTRAEANLWNEGKRVQAIKAMRQRTDWDIRACRDALLNHRNEMVWQPFESLDDLPLDEYILFKIKGEPPFEYHVGQVGVTGNGERLANIGSRFSFDVEIVAWKVMELCDV